MNRTPLKDQCAIIVPLDETLHASPTKLKVLKAQDFASSTMQYRCSVGKNSTEGQPITVAKRHSRSGAVILRDEIASSGAITLEDS
ncbi:hypothetical protein COMA2_20122 [Candidatus Nitrospira nitrificans]|uniref:Uncharacterized protein n=1 Tax=Candidatus Nitrospira nitrificans TaxID=1742973 RepID=A0A0S4LD79_9BACT|nr:hypothetical protein COMA2_20122 [Candidatus Nitrospira nitrificans]